MSLSSSSSFRRSGQRDDRRRRLLTDELANPGDWPSHRSEPDEGDCPPMAHHYGDAEFLNHQPRLLDLAPRGWIALSLGTTAAVAAIVGIEAAYLWMLDRTANGAAVVAALDLGARGSLGCWLSSLLLLVASVTAMLIYSIRRHRVDDYQGRYHIWIWAAACWMFMATDQAASLREGFRDLMIGLTATPLSADGNVWWVILYALLLGAIGSRLVIEMRCNPASVGVFLGAMILFLLTILIRLDWLLPSFGEQKIPVLSGVEMIGCLALTVSMLLYVRHVIFDAEGLLPERDLDMEEAEAQAKAEIGSPQQPWLYTDTAHATPQPAFQRNAAPPVASSIPSPVNRKLTKQEKKALKERLLRERMERQRRGL